MSRFLLEIGSEEIPARMQAAAAAQLAKRFTEACAAAGLTHGHVSADATPRRLWLIADNIADASASSSEERRGPRADAPDAALQGFLRSTGLSRDQLEERDTGKGIFLFAVIQRKGRPASEILSEVITQIVTGLDWPKSMRWGAASTSTASPRWVRPLTHLVALLGSEIVPATAYGLTAGRTSRGHRIHAPGPLDITSADTYAAQLRSAYVYASSFVRRQILTSRAAALAADAGLTVIPDEGLEIENAGLTEWPVPLLGRFDPSFLAVPAEVIQLTMRTNQKYFALKDSLGLLAPAFICVANIEASDGGQSIVQGNERVLSARLHDARFFWDQDVKTVGQGGLNTFLPKLADIKFHSKLGSVHQKTERIADVSPKILEQLLVNKSASAMIRLAYFTSKSDSDSKIRTASLLCKSDLVSATVGEFPETQGKIGSYLEYISGATSNYVSENPPHVYVTGNSPIADAIYEHYLPANANDIVPDKIVSVLLGLADRFDSLVGFFYIANEVPTGSKDPFALRRQALACISLITKNSLRLSIEGIVLASLASYRNQGFEQAASANLLEFIIDRLKVQQREAGVQPEIIDAVVSLGGEDDIVRLLARVIALQAFLATEDGKNLLAGYKRAANILKAEDAKDGPHQAADLEPQAFTDAAERALHEALATALPAAAAAVEAEDFTAAMAALAGLRGPVDQFFTDLMVNAPEPALRKNRLALLAAFRDAVHSVADFSRIEG